MYVLFLSVRKHNLLLTKSAVLSDGGFLKLNQMATQKQIKSAINVLKARLKQINTSDHFSESEREPLSLKINKRLDILGNQKETE